MASTGHKAAATRRASERKGAGKSGKDKATASGGKTASRPISPDLQAQMDATQELNPAARGRHKS
jgi:hypothetical protein